MKVASHSITLALVVVLGSLLTSMASAQTQARMTEEALAELKRVDDQMGVIYQRIIQRYSKGADANPTLAISYARRSAPGLPFEMRTSRRSTKTTTVFPLERCTR